MSWFCVKMKLDMTIYSLQLLQKYTNIKNNTIGIVDYELIVRQCMMLLIIVGLLGGTITTTVPFILGM